MPRRYGGREYHSFRHNWSLKANSNQKRTSVPAAHHAPFNIQRSYGKRIHVSTLQIMQCSLPLRGRRKSQTHTEFPEVEDAKSLKIKGTELLYNPDTIRRPLTSALESTRPRYPRHPVHLTIPSEAPFFFQREYLKWLMWSSLALGSTRPSAE